MKGKADDTAPRGDQWVYELKWDGMRALAFITADDDGLPKVRLQSSNGRDITRSFPDLSSLGEVGTHFNGVVLDGEIVAFDGARPSFNTLQSRMHVSDPAEAARRARITPVVFVAFDLLHLDGHDTMAMPLANRRALLEQLSNEDPCWTICEQHDDNVDALLDVVRDSELEGVVAKKRNSVYQAGRRSPDWIKIKPRLRQEFVVGGWLGGRGSRSGGLGSLLVGYYENDQLLYAGSAGSGLTNATQDEWREVLIVQPDCPFVEVPTFPRDKLSQGLHWCEPTQVVEIAFHEWGDGGHLLRHPVVLGRRSDKDPAEVFRE